MRLAPFQENSQVEGAGVQRLRTRTMRDVSRAAGCSSSARELRLAQTRLGRQKARMASAFTRTPSGRHACSLAISRWHIAPMDSLPRGSRFWMNPSFAEGVFVEADIVRASGQNTNKRAHRLDQAPLSLPRSGIAIWGSLKMRF